MTAREAHELCRAIEALWRLDLGSEGRELWAQSLIKYEHVHATQAVIQLSERQRERPTLADIRQMITKVQRDTTDRIPAIDPGKPGDLPLWIKRWACSRYLYAQFNRRQDMRKFPEQGDWRRGDLMPDTEWETEARTVSSATVYAAIRTASGTSRPK